MEAQFQSKEMDRLDEKTEDLLEDSGINGQNFKDLALGFIKGENGFGWSNVWDWGKTLIFRETADLFSFMKKLILLAIFSALLKNLNPSFQNKAVNEISFAICYIVLVFLVMESFSLALQMVTDGTQRMTSFLEAVLPVFVSLMISSGSLTQTAVIVPVVGTAANVISTVVGTVVLPAVGVIASLTLLNHISPKSILSQFTELFTTMIRWLLRGMALLFMGILSLQRLGVPPVNQIVGKAARTAVDAVPVVGEVMSGAVETAAALAGAIKNGAAAAAIVALLLLCLLPVIKLTAMIFIYKLTAAVIQPICEARLVKSVSAAGDFTGLLLSALFTVETVFIFSMLILSSVV